MVQEAAQHKTEDEQRKQLIEAKNQGDSLVYQSEKLLKDLGEKVTPDQRSSVEAKVKEVKDALASDNLSAIQSATQALQQELQIIGQAAYQQEQPGPQSSDEAYQQPDQGKPESGEDVIDGEFTEA